jgi:hypothetical protein
MGRYYLALIDYPLKDNLTIERSIGRNPSNRLKMAVVPDGRYAKTDFARIAQSRTGTTELVAARLHTGRTHQIRVHLSSVGRHIIGDELYGYRDSPKMKERIFLHAFRLYFTHPASGKRIEIKAPLPEDMKSYMIKITIGAKRMKSGSKRGLTICSAVLVSLIATGCAEVESMTALKVDPSMPVIKEVKTIVDKTSVGF